MLKRMKCVAGLCIVLALAARGLHAEKTAADPAKVDADFAIQGEYTGEIEGENGDKIKVGVQIIAQGDGKFIGTGYGGGLPGDGWESNSGKAQFTGETANGLTTLTSDVGTVTIKDGEMTGMNKDGKVVGKMKRVIRQSSTLGDKPPEGAIVLFAGKNADEWTGGKVTEDGLLEPGPTSKRIFKDCTLHVEFMLPYEPAKRDQDRGNSGCYLQGRYEVQILDSFGLEGKNNECGGIYGISEPAMNMCFPPLSWQSYDIDFTAAKWEGDKKTKNAMMTVRHNGTVIHRDVEVPNPTTAAPVKESADAGPIYLQDHGHPVRFRNIWIVEKK
jgi:hypothetical protein